MKHSHSHFARLRAGWQSRAVRTVVATGALALVISALPMLALRLTDIGLFTAPHARTQATGVLSPKGDDLYLVRALAQRRQQAGGESEAPYGEMDMGYEGQALMASYLDEMQAAGVLPQELTEAFRYAAESGTAVYTYQADGAGFLTLALTEPEINRRLYELTVESHTGKVVSARLWMWHPFDVAAARADMLRAYCEYLGLDMLEDWAACTGTYYGEEAIYSANGETLVAASTVWDDVLGDQYLLLDARVLPADQYDALQSAYAAKEAGGALAPCQGLQRLGSTAQPLDETRCLILPVDTGYGTLLTVLDKTTMQQSVLCAKPGCAHTPQSGCPALLQPDGLHIFARAGRVYNLCFESESGTGSYVLRAMTPDFSAWEELARTSAQEYEAYSQMAWYAGGDMLYGFFCTDAAGLETQSALLAMELDGGTPQQVPVSPGTKVLGTWNGLFVCSRTVPPAAVAQLRPGALEETYREAEYNATGTEIFLKSPVTGAEQAVTLQQWTMPEGGCVIDGDTLYFVAPQYYADAEGGYPLAQLRGLMGIDLRLRAAQRLYNLADAEIVPLEDAYGGYTPVYGESRQWLFLATGQRIPAPAGAQYTDPYGMQADWTIAGQWGEDLVVINRAGLLESGAYWQGFALIPAEMFWARHTQPAIPFEISAALLNAAAAAGEAWW